MPKKNKNEIFEQDLGVITKEKPEVKKPDMYAVVLINDDYTPMEFVIYVLQTIFKKIMKKQKKLCYWFIMRARDLWYIFLRYCRN